MPTTTFLDTELQKIQNYLPYINLHVPTISQANVSWHLSHSIMVADAIYESLKNSKPADFQPNFNLKRSILFKLKYFPRGVAKSPKQLKPPETVSRANIERQLFSIRNKLNLIEQLDTNAHFEHPIFGQCNLKVSKDFLKAHTHHHMKIVRDIIKNSES